MSPRPPPSPRRGCLVVRAAPHADMVMVMDMDMDMDMGMAPRHRMESRTHQNFAPQTWTGAKPQQAGAGGEQRRGQQRGGRGRQHGRKRNLYLYLYLSLTHKVKLS